MTRSKEDPLAVLRGPTHYVLADGASAYPGRTCWLWDGRDWGKPNGYLALFGKMVRTQPGFGPEEIAFEVYDDET